LAALRAAVVLPAGRPAGRPARRSCYSSGCGCDGVTRRGASRPPGPPLGRGVAGFAGEKARHGLGLAAPVGAAGSSAGYAGPASAAGPSPQLRRARRPASPAAPRVRSPRAALRTASAALGGRPRPAAVGLLDSCGGLRPGRWATRRYSRRVLSQRPQRSSASRLGARGPRRGQAAGGRERGRPAPRASGPCGPSAPSPAPASPGAPARPAGPGACRPRPAKLRVPTPCPSARPGPRLGRGPRRPVRPGGLGGRSLAR